MANNKKSIMKKFINLTGLLLVFVATGLQAQVQSSPGLKLVATGPLKLVLQDAALVNNGQFIPGNSTVLFKGSAPTRIGGNSAIDFHNIVVGEEIVLDNDIRISGSLTLEKGNLQLNNHSIDLG